MIAGFERPDEGSVELAGRDVTANYARPNQLPVVNVVGVVVILLSIIAVYLANRLSQDPVGAPAAAGGARA